MINGPGKAIPRAPFVAPKGWVVAPCPKKVPTDLKEGARVALYYDDPYNEWWFGTLVTVNRRKTSTNNVEVRFKTEVYSQLLEAECYGPNLCWVLLMKEKGGKVESRPKAKATTKLSPTVKPGSSAGEKASAKGARKGKGKEIKEEVAKEEEALEEWTDERHKKAARSPTRLWTKKPPKASKASREARDLQRLHLGDKIEARHAGGEWWFPGHVVQIHDNGTYDIDYEDGDHETEVRGELIESYGTIRAEVETE